MPKAVSIIRLAAREEVWRHLRSLNQFLLSAVDNCGTISPPIADASREPDRTLATNISAPGTMAGVDPSGSGGIQATDGAGTATGLVSMADYFLGLDPQRIHEAVQCLMGALALTPPPRIEARARLQLGMVLYRHTCNLIEAREHLDKAVSG